ncbi:MAG: sulfite exporter TauE/SafE family protein [Desulfobacteraceae bacterium]|nr:sulfite exporter TauE/SafE family protein [Desulfobacteraceae bacterium]
MGSQLWLLPLGFLIGAFGTLIGAGGGFVLMPLLLLFYSDQRPEILTSISLAVTFFNALSGSAAYARMRRIDYRSGLMFAAATIPGAVFGALHTASVHRRVFDLIFGVVLLAVSVYLFWQPAFRRKRPRGWSGRFSLTRTVTTADGETFTYSFNAALGLGLSLAVGYFSSFLGIGGGIIHVPIMARLLDFPVHVATATSHFVLAIMTLVGTLVHVAMGNFRHSFTQVLLLAAGVLAGAQLGAVLSNHVRGRWIIRGLATALAFVGVRILAAAIGGGAG